MVAASGLPAAAVALAVLLPFLGKAFTIDDVTFLLQAKHILRDPLHPTAMDMVFHGVRLRLSHELVTGPVMAYLPCAVRIARGSRMGSALDSNRLSYCGGNRYRLP